MVEWPERIAIIGAEELRRAVFEAEGDFDRIDFPSARERVLAKLTAEERAAMIAAEYEAADVGEFDRCTPEAVEMLRGLGCWNPPEPDTIEPEHARSPAARDMPDNSDGHHARG